MEPIDRRRFASSSMAALGALAWWNPPLFQARSRVDGARINGHLETLSQYGRNLLSFHVLNQHVREWEREFNSFNKSLVNLRNRISTLQAGRARLLESRLKWERTMEAYRAGGITGAPLERSGKILSELDQARAEMDSRLASLLACQEKLVEAKTEIQTHFEFTTEIQIKLEQRIWQSDRPTLISSEFFSSLSELDFNELASGLGDCCEAARSYSSLNAWKSAFFLVLVLVLWLWLRDTLPRARKRTEDIPHLDEARAFFRRPFSIALLLTCLPLALVSRTHLARSANPSAERTA